MPQQLTENIPNHDLADGLVAELSFDLFGVFLTLRDQFGHNILDGLQVQQVVSPVCSVQKE